MDDFAKLQETCRAAGLTIADATEIIKRHLPKPKTIKRLELKRQIGIELGLKPKGTSTTNQPYDGRPKMPKKSHLIKWLREIL